MLFFGSVDYCKDCWEVTLGHRSSWHPFEKRLQNYTMMKPYQVFKISMRTRCDKLWLFHIFFTLPWEWFHDDTEKLAFKIYHWILIKLFFIIVGVFMSRSLYFPRWSLESNLFFLLSQLCRSKDNERRPLS